MSDRHGVRPSADPTAWIGRMVDIRIDRPLGSRHPRHPDLVYGVNYGYVPDTRAADGHPIDAYVLGIDKPLAIFSGRCIAILERLDDVEDKLCLAPDGQMFDDRGICAAIAFQERFFRARLHR